MRIPPPTSWERLGTRIGLFLATYVPSRLGAEIRHGYAEKYGRCRRCAGPLGGPSPEQICEQCHA